jgi:hypothetical protein
MSLGVWELRLAYVSLSRCEIPPRRLPQALASARYTEHECLCSPAYSIQPTGTDCCVSGSCRRAVACCSNAFGMYLAMHRGPAFACMDCTRGWVLSAPRVGYIECGPMSDSQRSLADRLGDRANRRAPSALDRQMTLAQEGPSQLRPLDRRTGMRMRKGDSPSKSCQPHDTSSQLSSISPALTLWFHGHCYRQPRTPDRPMMAEDMGMGMRVSSGRGWVCGVSPE